MKKLFWLLFFINILYALPAQTSYQVYYVKTTNAYVKMADNNYGEAVKLYEDAFSDNYYPFSDDLANLRDCYLAIGDTARAFECVKRMIACGWTLEEKLPVVDYRHFNNDMGAFDSTRILAIRGMFPSLRQEYLKKIDNEENAYWERIVYNEVLCVQTRLRFGQKKADYAWLTNLDEAIILLKNKELNREKIDAWNGIFALMALVHLAQSTTVYSHNKKVCDSLFYQLMDLLKKEVIRGNLHPDNFAVIYDAAYSYRHGKSYYGRELTLNPKTGLRSCFPVEDVDNVDARRAEIGLPPIWAFCKKYDITPPVNYKSKNIQK